MSGLALAMTVVMPPTSTAAAAIWCTRVPGAVAHQTMAATEAMIIWIQLPATVTHIRWRSSGNVHASLTLQ